MSDVFISYSSADRERARLVADALHRRGWSVWWDRAIAPGRQYDEVIEEALGAAGCVVVLWTQASTASSWVKNEASDAMERRVLIPAVLDPGLRIPLEFRRIQAADLSRWKGEASTPEFELFCAAIASIVAPGPLPPGPAPAPAPAPAPPPAPQPPAPQPSPAPPVPAPARGHGVRNVLVGVAAVVGVLAAIGLWNENEGNASGPAPRPMPAPSPLPVAAAVPLRMTVAWRDDALRYAGTLSWDGRSSVAQVSLTVSDGATGRSLGSRQLDAAVQGDGHRGVMFSTAVPVDGDSQTAGPHTHAVNLFFQAQPGGWLFVRNCMAANRCWEASS